MDEVGIGVALLSISSPHVSFLDQAKAVTLCRAVNDAAAELRRRHAGRFGAFAILPLHDVAARQCAAPVQGAHSRRVSQVTCSFRRRMAGRIA
jgi:hypothetical protein